MTLFLGSVAQVVKNDKNKSLQALIVTTIINDFSTHLESTI